MGFINEETEAAGSLQDDDLILIDRGAATNKIKKQALLGAMGGELASLIDSLTAGTVAGDMTFVVADNNGDPFKITVSSLTASDTFSEAVDDRVSALLTAGSNISLAYNDATGVLEISAAAVSSVNDEAIDDRVATLINASTGVSLVYDDAGDQLTLTNTAPFFKLTDNLDSSALGSLSGTPYEIASLDPSTMIVHSIVAYMIYDSAPYTLASGDIVIRGSVSGQTFATISDAIITAPETKYMKLELATTFEFIPGETLQVETTGANPATGDGTLRLIVNYSTL